MLEREQLESGAYREDRIGTALRGENPTLITRLRSGFVFLMDLQFLPGWCVLTAYPKVKDLNALPVAQRVEFLADMQLLGEAIEQVTAPVRMNYSILGNTDNYLHAHVYPRYAWEAPERLCKPAWFYFQEGVAQDPQWEVNEGHHELAESIKRALEALARNPSGGR